MPVSSLAPDDFAWLPATEQLAALDAKEVSSAELVELYLSRISTHNPSLNAIVTVDADAARRAATEADAARSRGDDLGPLHGLPITVKDSYETAGMRTVCGRPDLADYVPTQDAEAVARSASLRSHHRRQDQHADRQCRRAGQQSGVRPDEQPMGSFAHIRRLSRWRRRRYRGRADELRLRVRNRWLHPDSGSLLWPLRPQVDMAVRSTGRPHPRRAGQTLDDGAKPIWPVPACRCVVPATSSPRWKPPSAR